MTDGVLEALVLEGSNSIFTLKSLDTDSNLSGQFEARIKGKKLASSAGEYNPLAVGDRVRVEPYMDAMRGLSGMITERLPRRNALQRLNKKNDALQTIAANIDLLVIVCSVGVPPFRPRFIDRVLVMAELQDIPVLIFVNKIDLSMSQDEYTRMEGYLRLGYEVLAGSCQTGEGIKELQERLAQAGNLSILFGQSGAGKSSLINSLVPGEEARVGLVSEKFGRGIHTTTMSHSYTAPWSGLLVDTPGIRHLSLDHLSTSQVSQGFREFSSLAPSTCKFANCTHSVEESCAVKEAVASGGIQQDRYISYLSILQGSSD